MNPHIELKLKPVNSKLNYNDDGFDPANESSDVFHVIVSENLFKLVVTVSWQSPETNPREFQVIRHDALFLDGTDRDVNIPLNGPPYGGKISADPVIVQELFSELLNPYGIVLDRVTVHKLTFFESINFHFTDPAKQDELYDRINEACQKHINK